MQLNNLKKNRNNRKPTRVGRGGKHAKTSGRGTKGQNARSGRKKRPEMRDVIKRLPKLRGRGKNFLKSRFADAQVLNLSVLEANFSAKDVIDRASLQAKGLTGSGQVKILANGSITKAVTIKGLNISESAKAAVEKAGGKVE